MGVTIAIASLTLHAFSQNHGSAVTATYPVDTAILVDPRIGTAGDGQTYPAVGLPFGMTQWTPATRHDETKCEAPYYDKDERLLGIRASHFLSGSCMQDYGSFQLMAGTGKLPEASWPGVPFAHADERMTPYRYDVRLPTERLRIALTGGARAAMVRFTAERDGPVWILLENNARTGDGIVQIDPTHRRALVVNRVRRLYAGQGKLAGFSGYSWIEFDRAFRIAKASGSLPAASADAVAGATTPSAVLVFDLKAGESILARMGTSFVDASGARSNLRAEIPDWNFGDLERRVHNAWRQNLGAIEIKASPAGQRIFYTALYHSLLAPRTFSDSDGRYPRFAGSGQVETARGFTYYDDFSAWDTFRALHPLVTLIDPAHERDMVRSLIAKGEQGGFLPIFPAWNNYTSEMIGDHASAIIMDAWAKGIRGFDAEHAYALMRHNAMDQPVSEAEYKDGRGRRALNSYLQYGYVPLEDPVADAFHHDEQVSRTLEYAYDDFVVGRMASLLGKNDDARIFAARSGNWRNVIDPVTGFARGRHSDGSWVTPFDPKAAASYITEGNPFQYTFFVPQDVRGLIEFEHGERSFVEKLDSLFALGLYDQGNEPSHHIAYLYDYAGAAAKTQAHVHDILTKKYTGGPDGLPGNDDGGQTSAWYVMSALGFYSVTPGIPAYEIGTPHMSEVTIHFQNGRSFHIAAHGLSSQAYYIRSATLNGTPLNRFWLTHEEITRGGELIFEMSDRPVHEWPADHLLPQ
ncbi:MAG TPA: GH92 family glycosyl hydrolase [Acidobacteriaceae bacterium]